MGSHLCATCKGGGGLTNNERTVWDTQTGRSLPPRYFTFLEKYQTHITTTHHIIIKNVLRPAALEEKSKRLCFRASRVCPGKSLTWMLVRGSHSLVHNATATQRESLSREPSGTRHSLTAPRAPLLFPQFISITKVDSSGAKNTHNNKTHPPQPTHQPHLQHSFI